MSLSLSAIPADVCHAIGGLVLVLDAGLVTLLLTYWKETAPPRRSRPRDRSLEDRRR